MEDVYSSHEAAVYKRMHEQVYVITSISSMSSTNNQTSCVGACCKFFIRHNKYYLPSMELTNKRNPI